MDPTKQKYFHKFDFLENNYGLLKKKYKYDDFKEMLKTKKIMKFKEKNKTSNKTIMDAFPPNKNFGSISEKCFAALQDKNFTNEDDKK